MASAFDAPVPVFYAILLAQGAITSVHSPASSSLVPMVIPREDLLRANRVGSSLGEVASIGGPALAGLALVWWLPWAIYATIGADRRGDRVPLLLAARAAGARAARGGRQPVKNWR